jgi:hypothetical protein
MACSFPDYGIQPAALLDAGVGASAGSGAGTTATAGVGAANAGATGGRDTGGSGAAGGAAGASSACSASPCLNEGRCFESGPEYACLCPAGFQGKNCELQLTFCDPNPCLNGGTCLDTPTNAVCDCAVGFSGDRCQTNVDDCTPNPCQNGGVCTDAVNAYSCACASGYLGDVCSGSVMQSCAAILGAQPGAASGIYTIDPDGMNQGKPPMPVYCDMTTDGGGYTRIGHEDVGASGTYKFLGLESGNVTDVANASGNGYFGPRFAGRYHTLRITWQGATSGHLRLRSDVELFSNDVNTAIVVTELDTSSIALSDMVRAAGGARFCRASSSPDARPGDTSWAIKPQNDSATECGCSASNWAGQGAFYGGHLNATSCGGYGGGWAAVRSNGEAKAGMNDVSTELWIR